METSAFIAILPYHKATEAELHLWLFTELVSVIFFPPKIVPIAHRSFVDLEKYSKAGVVSRNMN